MLEFILYRSTLYFRSSSLGLIYAYRIRINGISSLHRQMFEYNLNRLLLYTIAIKCWITTFSYSDIYEIIKTYLIFSG